jgi:hypothetical protein
MSLLPTSLCQERDTIINRFHEKRKRRVWVKKIRYHCRKNLADNRVRVKGRFVRHSDNTDNNLTGQEDEEDDYEDDEETDLHDTSPAKKMKNSKKFLASDGLAALLFVSETRLKLEPELQTTDDNISNGSGSTSTSTHHTSGASGPASVTHRTKTKTRKHKLYTSNDDVGTSDSTSVGARGDHEEDEDRDRVSEEAEAVPSEQMSLVENVRSRKRMRRHSIAY